MPQNSDQLLREIYRLTRENNELMHRARRSAFFWGFLKFVIYAALIIAPIWFYMTYLNGAVNQMLQTMNKIEGVNTQSQSQLQGFESAWQQFQSRFGGATSTSK